MSGRFSARLHGPGQPNAGLAVQAEFRGASLYVGTQPMLRIEAMNLAVSPGGFNQEDVVLGWDDAHGSWGLMVSDAASKATLLQAAPPVLAPALGRWNRSASTTRVLWRAIFTVGATAGLLVALGLWQYDRVVAWTAANLSPENERRLGQSVMDSVRAKGRLVEKSEALDLIRDIGGRLTRHSTRKYEWYLIDDPSINAFAVPGGFVVVNAGLVHAAASADELAGVLAHEVEHVEQRHSLQAMLYQLGWATVLAVVLGDPSAVTALFLLEMGNLKFSRDLEAQADRGGAALLRRENIPPQAMADFFRKIAKEDGGGGLAWISTHPDTGERIEAIEAIVREQPCASCQPLAVDWATIHESLYRDELVRRPADKPAPAAATVVAPVEAAAGTVAPPVGAPGRPE